MDESWLVVLIPVVFIPVFVAFWSGIVFLISFVSGWSQLKGVYRYDLPFNGDKSYMIGGRIRRANYKSVLTIGRNEEGLYLSLMWPYRPGHPPLFIPWDEITMTEGKILFGAYTEMTFERMPKITVRLYRCTKEWLLEKKSDNWGGF